MLNWLLLFALSSATLAKADIQCKWRTTFNNKRELVDDAIMESFPTKEGAIKYLKVNETKFALIVKNAPKQPAFEKPKALYTLFQHSAIAEGPNDSLKYVPIYVTKEDKGDKCQSVRYLEPIVLDIEVRLLKVGTQEELSIPMAARIRKYMNEDDENPQISDLEKYVGKVIFELNDLDEFIRIKNQIFGESAFTLIFIRILSNNIKQTEILRRFVATSVYPDIAENYVGEIVSNQVKFWLHLKVSKHILYFDAEIDEVKSTITVVGNPACRAISFDNYEPVQLESVPKFKTYRKNLLDEKLEFGFCRVTVPTKERLLRITIKNVTRIGGFLGFFGKTEIVYSNVTIAFP